MTREIITKNESNNRNSVDGLNLEAVLVDNVRAIKVVSGSLGQDGVYKITKTQN